MIGSVDPLEPIMPIDLRKVLAKNPIAKELWDDLTPIARRDWISWIESAKQAETRKRRVESIPSRLASGKRRPCCYALVPMKFYTALNGSQKAKAHWKSLTPSEKRDMVRWVESATHSEERRMRVEKACLILASGKRHV